MHYILLCACSRPKSSKRDGKGTSATTALSEQAFEPICRCKKRETRTVKPIIMLWNLGALGVLAVRKRVRLGSRFCVSRINPSLPQSTPRCATRARPVRQHRCRLEGGGCNRG